MLSAQTRQRKNLQLRSYLSWKNIKMCSVFSGAESQNSNVELPKRINDPSISNEMIIANCCEHIHHHAGRFEQQDQAPSHSGFRRYLPGRDRRLRH